MDLMKLTSRRSVLVLAAGMPAIIKARGAQSSPKDIDLLQLGEQFDVLAAHLDHAIEHRLHVDWAHLEELSRVEAEILQMPALSMEGFYTKARVACWATLGDLEERDQADAYERMARSIIRDLIRLHRPDLEHPGALRKLVESEENSEEPHK
jgi:endonuclease/exonuclease/phosphatase family metal-dependent hydrolase